MAGPRSNRVAPWIALAFSRWETGLQKYPLYADKHGARLRSAIFSGEGPGIVDHRIDARNRSEPSAAYRQSAVTGANVCQA